MDTKTKILDAAEALTQTVGFNGFSYLHLADELGIKTSSIHYHFKTKADLALALVTRVDEVHLAHLNRLNEDVPAPEERLRQLVVQFEGYVRDGEFCMCGMLSAEIRSINAETKARLGQYFRNLQNWAAAQFDEMGEADPGQRALQFVSTLEGSLLIARLSDEPAIVRNALARFSS